MIPAKNRNCPVSKIFKIIVIILFLFLFGRLIQLQIFQGKIYAQKARDNMIREIPIPAPRGNILDRYGEIFARSTPRYGIFILPEEMTNPVKSLEILADTMKLSEQKKHKLLNDLKENANQAFLLNEKMDEATMARVAELQSNISGIYLEATPVRFYPYKSLACHVIGYVGEVSEKELEAGKKTGLQPGDIVGKDGIEDLYDKYLRGVNGSRRIQVDVSNRMIHLLEIVPSKQGDTFHLTLDLKLQRFAETEMSSMREKINRQKGSNPSGAVIVMKAGTGEILAMASIPGFDLNPFVSGITANQYNKIINDPLYPMLNRAISCAYPCGSTFKLITSSASLQEGVCTDKSVFYCPGVFYLSDHPFYCFVKSGHGTIDFNQAIAQSCDVVFYKLGHSLGINRLRKYAESAGFGRKTGIDLPGETSGLLPDEKWKEKEYEEPWYAGDTVNLSIGQGYIEVTPLQMAVATAAVANGGSVVIPYIVSKITDIRDNVILARNPGYAGHYPVSDKFLSAVRKGLRSGVINGSGAGGNSSVVEIAGKTGTAENAPCPENPYGLNHAWFTCFLPYENPDIVITVMFEKSGGFGGSFAAPVAKSIGEEYIKLKKERESKPEGKINTVPD